MKKMHIAAKLCALVIFAISMAGCAQSDDTITSAREIPAIHSVVGSGHSVQDVRAAILKAGKQRRWIMSDNGSGMIIAKVTERSHEVEVHIPYTSSSYSIEYASSVHMKARRGKIHRNYYRWVRNLNKQIQLNLSSYN